MKDNHPLQHDVLPTWIALKYKFEILHVSGTSCRPFAIRPRDQDDPRDDAHPEGENSAKRQKTSKHGTYVIGESSFGQVNESEPDDDELTTEKVSQELMEEMSQTVDEAKLCKVVNEMLRQRCTSRDEHQYHIDQMQNFLKNNIVCFQRDSKAPALSLVNQDLLYLKKGNSGPEKIVLSLHKFPAVIFPDDDIKERTSRWVDKKVDDYDETGLLWSLSIFIRILEGLKSYNNDVKHGYVTPSLSKEDAEYLQLLKEEIEERLKHRDKMRC
ncbi:hypothetical protein Tco_0132565 [Tanacetum coccineum]